MNAFELTNETKNYRSLNYFKKYKNQKDNGRANVFGCCL